MANDDASEEVQENEEPRQQDSAQQTGQEPPQPPSIDSSLHISGGQLLGLAFLALLPLLALFGFFDANLTSVNGSNEEVVLQVEYASRHRYKMREELTIAVTNRSQQSPATVNVLFEKGFMDNFTELSFVPDVATVSEEGFLVQLSDMASGERRIVHVGLKGEQLWKRTGVILASIEGGQPVSVTVNTWILP